MEKSQILILKNKEGSIKCRICNTKILREVAVTSCGTCYDMTHLQCLQKWAKDCIQNTCKMEHKYGPIGRYGFWYCSQCKVRKKPNEVPKESFCFCGKEKHEYTLDCYWADPHSCGEVCGKLLVPTCPHTCSQPCHPGACPPCPRVIAKSCHCGKTKRTQRCRSDPFGCTNKCGRRLNCGKHFCTDQCHPGECGVCTQTESVSCMCGKSIQKIPCGGGGRVYLLQRYLNC
eukprot:UN25789